MDDNYQHKTYNSLVAAEDVKWAFNKKNKLWIPQHEKPRNVSKERGGFSGRSLWDWLNLLGVLAIPFAVTFLGLYATQQLTQQQAQASEMQHQIDVQIAQDQEQETTLKTYLDNISDLLLNHNLSQSKPGDAASEVAREWTLTALRRLNANRNDIVLQFLQDAGLIGGELIGRANESVINFISADLSTDDLSGTNLSNTNLSGADLYRANLYYANLNGADLNGATLLGANLNGADLRIADLNGADLLGARFYGARFYGAQLYGADLRYADLYGADLRGVYFLTQQQLDQVYSCRDAILPTGLTCHHTPPPSQVPLDEVGGS